MCSTVERAERVKLRLVAPDESTDPPGETAAVSATLEDAYLDTVNSHDAV